MGRVEGDAFDSAVGSARRTDEVRLQCSRRRSSVFVAGRRVGAIAAALPSPAALRQRVGLVAHVFATPIPVVWGFGLRELFEWTDEAVLLMKRIHGAR